MKPFCSNTISGAVMLLAALLFIGCSTSDDDHDNPVTPPSSDATMNIVETAADNGNFETLVAALQAAGLDDDLAGAGPFTVFAPTDDAFALLPAGTIDFLLDPANQSVLIDILTYHVIAAEVSAAGALALNGTSATMLNALKMRIDEIGGDLILNLNASRQARITLTDIVATNGVIHVIDAVLDPDDAVVNIVETAVDNGNFTTLVAALQAAGLDDDLEGDGPFTVFAPTDDAFDNLPPGTVATLLEPANQTLLIDILTYHVFDGSVLSSAATALSGQNVPMLSGANMSIDAAGGALVLNLGGNRPATVIITDVLCANGVIHVIDAVLDPADAS